MSGVLSWSVQQKAKPYGRRPMWEETRPDHAMRSSVAITKLPLGRDIPKNKKKEKCDFLKIIIFWIFYLSGLVIVHTVSLLAQEHSKYIYMEEKNI